MARILAVDDDLKAAARLAEILGGDGHEAMAATCAEALAVFGQQGPFDLAAIDLEGGPDLGGIELCRRLKAASYEYLPVMLFSTEGTVGERVTGLDAGADEYLMGTVDPQELLARVRALLRIRASHRQAADVAHIDLMTGIANRRALEAQIKSSFAMAQRHKAPFAVLSIDLDGLEKMNNSHGRDAGDEVRRVAASAIQGCLRATDGAFCVQGGEFVVIAPGADVDGAMLLGERIRRAIESSTVPWKETELHATASVGLAVIPHREITTPDRLLIEAGRALLAAKRAGRNCLMVHGDDDETAG
ncbi:MAG: diguanylate cyclase [Deltaproteobacteria bacterium]|nr:diguanylate cyclase [Deltaproteobacteria bacterium]